MTHSPNPIYDQLKREVAKEKWRKMGVALTQVAELFRAMGEGYRDGMKKAASDERSPSSGSSSQAVSADSAPPHSLQDSGRPEGLVDVDTSTKGRVRDFEDGFLPGCTCEPGTCTCDVDWDAMAERRLDQEREGKWTDG